MQKPLLTVLAVSLIPAAAQGAIITPTSATATSSVSGTRTLTETINGNGLSGGGDPILDQTHASGDAGFNYWLGTTGVTQVLDFTLAGATDVAAVHFWQYHRTETANGWINRGLASFDISFSTDGVNYGNTVSISGLTGGAGVGFTAPVPVQTEAFALQSGVTHIRIDNLTNFGDPTWYGAGEFRFDTEPVPEPGSLALLGLGGVLLAGRRRR